MPRGDKDKYTDKQKRQAEHIEEGYEKRGLSTKEAERRAWATVNKETGGGKKSGSGRGKEENHEPSRKGGKKGAAAQSHATRVKAGKKAAATRSAGRLPRRDDRERSGSGQAGGKMVVLCRHHLWEEEINAEHSEIGGGRIFCNVARGLCAVRLLCSARTGRIHAAIGR